MVAGNLDDIIHRSCVYSHLEIKCLKSLEFDCASPPSHFSVGPAGFLRIRRNAVLSPRKNVICLHTAWVTNSNAKCNLILVLIYIIPLQNSQYATNPARKSCRVAEPKTASNELRGNITAEILSSTAGHHNHAISCGAGCRNSHWRRLQATCVVHLPTWCKQVVRGRLLSLPSITIV